MPKYRATVRVSGIDGESLQSVRTALDEQLRQSGLENCRIVNVEAEVPPPPVRRNGPASALKQPPIWRRQADTGAMLLVAAVAWGIWFFLWMLLGTPE